MDQAPAPQDVVQLYLRAQNLEQVERTDEAVELYERAVAAGFDAAGPYDRLIAIYTGREAHADVVRVADAALVAVRTFDDKRGWYERLRDEARAALPSQGGATPHPASQPDQRGAEF